MSTNYLDAIKGVAVSGMAKIFVEKFRAEIYRHVDSKEDLSPATDAGRDAVAARVSVMAIRELWGDRLMNAEDEIEFKKELVEELKKIIDAAKNLDV